MSAKAGFARLSLRPAMASAFAAGLGADGLQCVALFLFNQSAPLARSNPVGGTIGNKKGAMGQTQRSFRISDGAEGGI